MAKIISYSIHYKCDADLFNGIVIAYLIGSISSAKAALTQETEINITYYQIIFVTQI